MKEFKYIVFGLLLITSTVSCKKGWLDVTASNQIKADEQFAEASGFRDALMGVYIGMTDPALYAKDMTWNLVDLLSQQYNTLGGSAYLELQRFNYGNVVSRPYLDAIWNKQYNVIANINNALAYIDNGDNVLNNIEYGIIKGELLALRAFIHFDLIRLYGHGSYAERPELASRPTIPYVKQFGKELTPQLSYQETFKLLEQDLEEALDLLKEDPIYPNTTRDPAYYSQVNRDGFYDDRHLRMNFYAVKALQARVLAWQGNAKLAEAAVIAEEVIAQSFARLITSSTDVTVYRTLPPEHLFSLKIDAFTDIVNPSLTSDAAFNFSLYILNATAENLYETSTPGVGLVDIRYNALLASESRGKVSIKLRQDPVYKFHLMPLIKLPEMYYIAAEHYTTANPTKAIDLLNTVRRSRRINVDLPNGLTNEQVTNELFKEHRKEYVSEGQLFFYYKRIGREQIPGLSAEFTAGDETYVIPYPDNEVEFGNRVQ